MKTKNRLTKYIKPLRMKEYLLDLKVQEILLIAQSKRADRYSNFMYENGSPEQYFEAEEIYANIMDKLEFNQKLQRKLKGMKDD